MKKKCLEPSIALEKQTNLRGESKEYKVIDMIRDGYSMRMMPVSEAFVDKMASQLIEDSHKDENVLSIESFCRKHRLGRTTFDNWTNRFPFFKEAKEHAMIAFASRLENGVFKGTEGIRERAAREILPMYSKTWRDREEQVAALNKESQGSGSFVAVLEAFPSSEKVPPRIEMVEE